jgi:hypothetical protein
LTKKGRKTGAPEFIFNSFIFNIENVPSQPLCDVSLKLSVLSTTLNSPPKTLAKKSQRNLRNIRTFSFRRRN